MFSDLVGSTALSGRMDSEDLREVISAYQKCVAKTVRRFGGFVAKYLGDGVLVYFGYPQAHEDDAERAVRAGLELVAVVTGLKTRASLQTRVGIATGLVVVGDLIGSGDAQERGIVGETPNLAARLQGIAEPNMVVIAESTRRLLGNLFELEDLGAKDLKRIAGPVWAWAALRASLVESRFEALHASGLTDLVGREEEIELLLRRWSRAKTGEGQVVLLSGEAGIGKSRLTAALLESLAAEPHTRLRYFCCGNYAAASALAGELIALADEKGTVIWKAFGMMNKGCVLALTGKASEAVQMMTPGITTFRSTRSTVYMPWYLSNLTRAHAELGQFDDARRCIDEAMTAVETTKERWCEAEVHRTAGEIALMSPKPDAVQAEAYFERALTVARAQRAKSWELRAAMSMARLWRDQGKQQQARDLLAPVYGWFTEGFNTLDLKEAKALLDELHA
jgi:class 3 adenylate cyclase